MKKAFLVLLLAMGLALPASGAADGGGATCAGGITGTSFRLSCDSRVGGNPQGLLLTFQSRRLAAASVSAPAGISCDGPTGRVSCRGAAVRSGTGISGSFTLADLEPEEEDEEEGEGAGAGAASCAGGLSVTVVVFGSEGGEGTETESEVEAEEEEEEEEEESEATPVPIARLLLTSCPSKGGSGGGGGGGGGTTNELRIGRPKLDRHAGSALLPVTVSAPGSLALSGRGIVRRSASVRRAGTLSLAVGPTAATRRRLREHGHAAVTAIVTFTPSEGGSIAKHRALVLRLR